MDRRAFLIGAGAFGGALGLASPGAAQNYDHTITRTELPPQLMPEVVPIANAFAPGEIHVDPALFSLFLVLPDQMAIRYSVGIGRPGLYEHGVFSVGAKKAWPSWTPTPDMIKREPQKYKKYEDGMPGGPQNPLGARALYLFQPGRGDTFLRIHGTNAPGTIGRRVSNGCARLVNDHIVDLYQRVPLQAKVVLHPADRV